MALIKTTEEIKGNLPVSNDMDFKSLLPFVNQAERNYIIPVIGQAQYNELSTPYNTQATLTAPLQELLTRLQEAITYYAMYLWIPSGQLNIDDSGIRIANTETLKTAFQWQIVELQNSVLKQASSAMDNLLQYMEDHKSDYPLWVNDPVYSDNQDLFIKSADELTEYVSGINKSRLNYMALKTSMKKVEEFIIQPALGVAYFTELKTQSKAGTLTPANKEVVALIKKAVANHTIARGITEISVVFERGGIYIFNAFHSDLSTPDGVLIAKLEKSTKEDGAAYLELIRQHLFDNIANYPTYASSSVYNANTTSTQFNNSTTNKYFFAG